MDVNNNRFLPETLNKYVYNNSVNYTVNLSTNTLYNYNKYCKSISPYYSETDCQKYTIVIYEIKIPNFFLSNYPVDLYNKFDENKKLIYANLTPKNEHVVNSLLIINRFINSLKIQATTYVTAQVTKAIDDLITTYTTSSGLDTDKLLESYSSVTKGQIASVITPLSKETSAVFTSNPEKYPVISGSKLPISVATSTTNPITGHEVVDSSKIDSNTLLVIPSLVPGGTIEIGGLTILRGNGTNGGTSIQLNANNTEWVRMGSLFTLNNGKTIEISGIGSPVVFRVNNNKPVTIFDYLFMYSYLFAFIGAIFYAINCVINIDIPSIGLNKNVIIAFNVYITICGIIGLFTWSNYPAPFNIFNSNVVVLQLNDKPIF
jgi:hypothetical protein